MLGRKVLSCGLVLGLIFSASIPARAELIKNLKTEGSLETRSFSIDNETDRNGTADDHRGETRTRVMVGGTFDILDDVHGRVLIAKNNRLYGNGSEDVNTVLDNVFVENASVKIDKVFDRADLTMGRQFYGRSDDLVIYFGPQGDDVLSVTAVDVFRMDTTLGDWGNLVGIAGKVVDTSAAGATANGDTDLWGLELNTEKLLPKGALGLAYYTERFKGATTAVANNTVNVANVFAKGDLLETGLKYRAEYMQNFGEDHTVAPPADNDNDGNALFLGLGYGQNVMDKPFRAMAEWGRGTNNFQSVAAGKRFGKIWGEHTNAVGAPSTLNGVGGAGLSNLQVADIGVGINPLEKLGVDVNAYKFWYDAAVANGRTSAGTEYDLIVSWKHSDNVSLEASAATFQVGDALDNTPPTPTSPITRLGADVKIRF